MDDSPTLIVISYTDLQSCYPLSKQVKIAILSFFVFFGAGVLDLVFVCLFVCSFCCFGGDFLLLLVLFFFFLFCCFRTIWLTSSKQNIETHPINFKFPLGVIICLTNAPYPLSALNQNSEFFK